MSDEDIEKDGLIPEDTKCAAEVISSESYIGKESGKESTKIIFNVYHGDTVAELWVFLTPAFKKLWKHGVVSMLGEQVYNSGNVSPSMFEGKQCDVLIGMDEYKGKKKNVILDFFSRPRQPVQTDSTLPF
jgi:hypothetical protein